MLEMWSTGKDSAGATGLLESYQGASQLGFADVRVRRELVAVSRLKGRT